MPSNRSPQKPKPSRQWAFEAIGTQWWLGIYESLSPTAFARLKADIELKIESFDGVYSRFRPDSMVSQMASKAGKYILPDGGQLLNFYRRLYNCSQGRLTPLIGQLMSDAGYDADYSLTPQVLRDVPAWDNVLEVNGDTVIMHQPYLLDFGAAGKGYLVDLVSKVIEDSGVHIFCVDAGGDMVCSGLPPSFTVGLEHPDDPTKVIGVTNMTDGALCGSAGSRRKWAEFNHIINPVTKQSPTSLKSVWVIAADALTADGLATALFFSEPSVLRAEFEFEYLLLDGNNRVSRSAGFMAELFTAKGNR